METESITENRVNCPFARQCGHYTRKAGKLALSSGALTVAIVSGTGCASSGSFKTQLVAPAVQDVKSPISSMTVGITRPKVPAVAKGNKDFARNRSRDGRPEWLFADALIGQNWRATLSARALADQGDAFANPAGRLVGNCQLANARRKAPGVDQLDNEPLLQSLGPSTTLSHYFRQRPHSTFVQGPFSAPCQAPRLPE